MSSLYITMQNGRPLVVRDANTHQIRKSAANAGQRVIRTTVVRMAQVGRDEMTAAERFFCGNGFHALLPRQIDLFTDEATRQEIRERLAKSANPSAATEFGAGRARMSDILAAFPEAVVKGRPDGSATQGRDTDLVEDALPEAVGAGVFAEVRRLRKAEPDRGLFDVARETYASAAEDGAIDLKKAAEELDELTERFSKGRR